MMKRVALALVMAVGMVSMSGCNIVKAPATPGVAQFYSQAALVLNDFSGILLQAQQTVTTAHSIQLMNDADYRTAQELFKAIAVQGDAVQGLVKAGGDQATIIKQINAIIAQVGLMPTSFGIKNPSMQAQFTALVSAMQNILNAAITLVQTPAVK